MIRKLTVVVLTLALATPLVFSQAKPGGFARQLSMGAASVDRNIVLNPFIV